MRRVFLTVAAAVAFLAALTACPGARRMPTGPAPEYEEAPAPSWLRDGGAAPGHPLSPVLNDYDGGVS